MTSKENRPAGMVGYFGEGVKGKKKTKKIKSFMVRMNKQMRDLNSFYNSKLGRWIYTGERSVGLEFATKIEPYIDIMILRGDKIGQSKRYWGAAVGYGLDASAGISLSSLKYFGLVKDINFKTFEGPFMELNGGGSYFGLDFGGSVSYSPDFSGKSGGVLSVGSNIGVGLAPVTATFVVGGTVLYED